MYEYTCPSQEKESSSAEITRPSLPDGFCPPAVCRLMQCFAASDKAAYLVGGCVRDALMGRVPHDWDLAVTTLPEDTRRLCEAAGYRTIPTGIAHGTVTVLLPGTTPDASPEPVECTTCRTEGGYSDGRHPDHVTFTGLIRDDLSRRDFTVNAIAATPAPDGHFEVIDLFGGREDLQAGILRCVGDPVTRLSEDALRILRAVRFAVKLGFVPDPALTAAIPTVAPGLSRISRERIRAEFLQILCHPEAPRGLRLLHEWGLWPYVLPYGNPWGMLHGDPSGAGTTKRGRAAGTGAPAPAGDISALPPDPALRLAWLLWGQDETDAAQNLQGLRLPTETVRRAMTCLSEYAVPLPPPTSENARRLRHRLGDLTLPSLAVRAAHGQDTTALVSLVTDSVAAGDCVLISSLAVTGKDLTAIGIPAGRTTGQMLQWLLDLVLTDPSQNTFDRLMEAARRRRE